MGNRWVDRVRSRRQLSVYSNPSLAAGGWGSVLNEAIRDFNRLSRTHRLGVTLTQSSDPPAAQGGGGADVAVEAANGRVSCTYAGHRESDTVNGAVLQGLTLNFVINGRIEKSFIYLPGQPQVHTPQGSRNVGVNVMKVIAVHELVHACGLSNSDHSVDDLFHGFPNVDYGNPPERDSVRITVRGRYTQMPPLILSTTTVGRIRQLW